MVTWSIPSGIKPIGSPWRLRSISAKALPRSAMFTTTNLRKFSIVMNGLGLRSNFCAPSLRGTNVRGEAPSESS